MEVENRKPAFLSCENMVWTVESVPLWTVWSYVESKSQTLKRLRDY